MAVLDRSGTASPPEAEVLFPEARRRERKRRLVGGLLMLTVIATAIGLTIGLSGSGNGGGGQPLAGARPDSNPLLRLTTGGRGVTTLNLSKSDKYASIALVDGKIVLYGPVDDQSIDDRCHFAVVDPITLGLSDQLTGSCADPALEGRTVLPVETVERNQMFPLGSGIATIAVRVSHMLSDSRFEVGPVVMRFPQISTGWADWTYADGSLWLYDDYNPGGPDLLRFSEQSGAVIAAINAPKVDRPILVGGTKGVWIAPAVNSFGAIHAVYYVSGTTDQVTVAMRLPNPSSYVASIVASGTSALVDVNDEPRPPKLWRLTEDSEHPSGGSTVPSFDDFVELQSGSPPGLVGGQSGLFTAMANSAGTAQQVMALDTKTGRTRNVATLRPSYVGPSSLLPDVVDWQAIVLNNDLFLLDPPEQSGTYPYNPAGFSALYRINPSQTGAS